LQVYFLFFIFRFVSEINGATEAQSYLLAPASYISFLATALFVSILFMAALGIANALVWPAIYL